MPSREKWKMSFKSSATIITGKNIMLLSIPKKMQKTSVGFGNLHIND